MPARTKMTAAEAEMQTGDTYDIGRAASFVRLPDGTVVTARGTYTFRHVGEHAVINPDDGSETKFEVTQR